jgi:hypothetical protein
MESSGLFGALPFLGPLDTLFKGIENQEQPFSVDQSVINFWISDVRKPSENFAHGIVAMGGPAYQPAFVRYKSAGQFEASSQIDSNAIPDKGQVNIKLHVERFRPSTASKNLFANTQSGSLRLDLKQTSPLPELPEALAWTAVAAFLPKANSSQFGDLKDLTFDPGVSWGQLQQVPLTNGLGFWSWNFFLKPKDSFLGKMMTLFRQANTAVFPLLGLPGMALTALRAVDKLMGYLQARDQSNWLFKSVDTPIVATKEGMQRLGQGGIVLKTGHYLIIPQDQLAIFGAVRQNLDLQDGYLVKTGTDAFQLAANASTQIPDVDYLSVYVDVAQQPQNTGNH